MRKWFMVGAIAAFGWCGLASAQSPNPKAPRPAFAPKKSSGGESSVQQVKAFETSTTPVVLPPASAPALPALPAPAPGHAPAYLDDVAAACGEPCVSTGGCDTLCGPAGRFWIGAEYLLWQTKGNRLPALATGAPVGTPRNVAGTLGGPGTTTLIGDRDYANDWRSGFRLYGGAWLNASQTLGIDGDWFFLGESSTREAAGSDGSRIVTRPFTNTVRRGANNSFTEVAPFQDTQLVSFPNILSGDVVVDTRSEFFGAGANGIVNLLCNPCGRLDFLLGWRYLSLEDELVIRENLTGLAGSENPGTTFQVRDYFNTRNQFNGVNLGLAWERRAGSFFFNARGSVALGNTNSIVEIDGNTVITNRNGNAQNYAGGLLTQPSNIGRYELNKFATVTEVGLKAGLQVTDNLRVYAGYNFIYWSDVIRTGGVIDLRVNGSQIPPRTNVTGALYPRFEPRYTDFWAHGIVIGAQIRY